MRPRQRKLNMETAEAPGTRPAAIAYWDRQRPRRRLSASCNNYLIGNSPCEQIGKSDPTSQGGLPADPTGPGSGRRIPAEFVAIRLITRRLVPRSTGRPGGRLGIPLRADATHTLPAPRPPSEEVISFFNFNFFLRKMSCDLESPELAASYLHRSTHSPFFTDTQLRRTHA